ncbi:MAG: hypothetical protein V9E94_10505 [Microthrixaceae bacterium]
MEKWLFKQKANDPNYEAMRQSLGQSENDADLLLRLYDPQMAATYAAAHIRWLMEQEYGLNVSSNDLTVDQMTVIVAQYNIGPSSEIPVGDYSGYVFYELSSNIHTGLADALTRSQSIKECSDFESAFAYPLLGIRRACIISDLISRRQST